MPDAGYSGAPLAQKLGIKSGMRALLIAVPDVPTLQSFNDWASLKRAKTIRGASGGPYDYIHAFTADVDALARLTPQLSSLLDDRGMAWISWPKKSSGVPSSVTEDVVRRLALENGLVHVKVCAIDETWSGLKLVIPRAARGRRPQ